MKNNEGHIERKKIKKNIPSYADSDEDFESDNTYPYATTVVDETQQIADYTILECFMRQAIHDFSPLKPYKKTVMYWPTKNTPAAARMLIQRHFDDLQVMINRYGGVTALEMKFAKALRNLANNERAIQTRQIKTTFLSKQNPETRMAENIIEQELDLDQANPPRLHNNLDCVETIDELRELLLSPKMYQAQDLFDLFCLGLESGNFRQNKKRPYTPIDLLITKAHEAHFRTELYLALSKKSFRHHNTTSGSKERVKIFNQAIIAVREGRDRYMKKAVDTRMTSRTPRQVDECERLGGTEGSDDDCVDIEEDDL
jgi:hypothetical protein